jgi:hypothetical protein
MQQEKPEWQEFNGYRFVPFICILVAKAVKIAKEEYYK